MVHPRRGTGLAALGHMVFLTAVMSVLAPRASLARDIPFASQPAIPNAGDGPYSVHASDMDGDGDLDVLAAFSDDDRIAWCENDGATPPAWTARTITTTTDVAQSVLACLLPCCVQTPHRDCP